MALPKIDLPLYQCELPSTGKKIKYTPFTVKEEKILLTAQESKDTSQIILAIKQILNNCLQGIDVSQLSVFDIEYMLIQLRSRSVDNMTEFEITDPETEEKIKLELNLADVKVRRDDKHTDKIKISDEYTLFLRYPTIDQFEDLLDKEGQSAEDSYNIMIACLDKLASKDDVYKFSDFPKKEVDDFIESLHGDTIKSIKTFFDTMPRVRHEIPYTNSKGSKKTFVLEGTQTFFI
jgi:glycine cleavage system regulatory protein